MDPKAPKIESVEALDQPPPSGDSETMKAQAASPTGCRTPLEQAETRTNQANQRTKDANSRTDEANTRTSEANARTERAELQTDKAEANAMESRERYQAILHAAIDGFWLVDMDGHLLEVNQAYCLMSGYSLQELLAMRISDLELVESPEVTAAHCHKIMAEGKDRFLSRHRGKDGTVFDVEVSVQYQPGDGGRMAAFVRDITERRRAEEELRLRNVLLSTQQETSIDGILVVDENGRVLLWNSRFAELWRLPVKLIEDGVDAALMNFVTAQLADPRSFLERVKYLYEHRQEKNRDEVVLLDGRVFDRYSAPMFGADERYYGRVWYFRDITDRKQAEEAIRKQASLLDAANDAIYVRDLNNVVRYWNQGATRLCGWSGEEAIGRKITEQKRLAAQFLRLQRMESIGTLAGGIAHDLNNVLAPILMSAELLEGKVNDQASRSLLATLQISAQRGTHLVKQVLSFARGVEGDRVLLNLAHLVRELQTMLVHTFPKNIQFSLNLERRPWAVLGDPTQLDQVIMNLCVNARDAMPMGGTLTVTMKNIVLDEIFAGMNSESKTGAYVLVTVADTGTGMPPAIQERIFEPFFTTKEIAHGTGLGLPTSLAIVKGHGGFIRVDSEVGKGTTFRVYLPADQSAQAVQNVPRASVQLPHGHGELVLVVEDEADIRILTQKVLEQFGYRVLLATHGAEAVALYATHRGQIAVVLCWRSCQGAGCRRPALHSETLYDQGVAGDARSGA